MTHYIKDGSLQIAKELYDFINIKVIPESGVTQESFWAGFNCLVKELAPKNKELLAKRDLIQEKLHAWHKTNKQYNFQAYKAFLEDIGYLEPVVEDFQISTQQVDDEIAIQAGPQLVVPVNNARYAINAVNARWGSLYDALYGTDAISEDSGAEKGSSYNAIRGDRVIAFAKQWLDDVIPLKEGMHKEAVKYSIHQGELAVELSSGSITGLQDETQFIGYQGEAVAPSCILFIHHGIHFEIQIDASHPIGKSDSAHMKDILMEAAITTIMDCEDSVTAVDAEDKVLVYSNWLGLMRGDLTATFSKGERIVNRTLNSDRVYASSNGGSLTLSGRSLMFVRNVGHLMTINAILDEQGHEVPEGFLDCMVTSLIAKHTLLRNGIYQNSKKGSIYIVKPKMHGSEEVKFADELFSRVEDILGLARYTIKMGVMDEERRTSLNLKNCIHAVKERIVFINTGFLDRTGDEMHTSMEAGPMIRKKDMKASTWLNAYERSNVSTGLAVGLQDIAQIGKGMWAMPDLMADMLAQKGAQLQAGGNTAWVPSPTAAVLHAIHYHQIDVKAVQQEIIAARIQYGDEMLHIPIEHAPHWSPLEIQEELDNNAQGILGYVVRWVEMGIGCSKVPDINNVSLMEDRATLRISSQHIANWLHHGIYTKEQVLATLKRMATVVDLQNTGDTKYIPMAPDYDQSIAFQAACDLVFTGYDQPNGYTEPILHRRRIEAKAKITGNMNEITQIERS